MIPLAQCVECERQAAAVKAQSEATANAAKREALHQEVDRLEAIHDPIERLVTLVGLHARRPYQSTEVFLYEVELKGPVPGTVLANLYPEWRGWAYGRTPWPGREVAAWFASKAAAARISPDTEATFSIPTRSLLGATKWKSRKKPAWEFRQWPRAGDDGGSPRTQYVFADGTYSPSPDNSSFDQEGSSQYNLSVETIFQMAQRLGIRKA